MRTLLLLSLTIVVAAACLVPEDASAIPAFARRYKLSCTTCHNPFPRLKPFGDEFAANGFYLPEDDKDRDYVIAGDPLLRLNRDFPVAIRMDLWAQYDQGQSVETDLKTPWALKMLSGGPLTKGVGYYFYFFMSEGGEIVGVEDAYLHFNDLFGQPLDLLVGQFQVCDPLMKRELRLTFEDYTIYGTEVGDSRITLTYDRGLMASYAVEATGTGVMGMLLNGNGIPAAVDDKMDQDKYKNWAVRVAQDVTKYGSVGGFYYDGKEAPLGVPDSDRTNEATFWGIDARCDFETVAVTAQYMHREDTNPVFAASPGDKVETKGLVIEAVIAPQKDRSRNYFTLLYNRVDGDWSSNDYESYTAGITHLLARNLRLNGEFTLIADAVGREDDSRVSIGLVGAF